MVIIGNWKMNKDLKEAKIFLKDFFSNMPSFTSANLNLFLAPSFPLINEMKNIVSSKSNSHSLNFCAQNCSHNKQGAFTGEVSAHMLSSVGVSGVIIGHSERRIFFSESNDILLEKVNRCIENNLLPIFCFGETIKERNQGNFLEVIENQISLLNPYAIKQNFILAYEPIWAIGSGKTPSINEIEEVHLFVKNKFPNIKILYGGSLNSRNADEILKINHVDGGLIGGASLDPFEFISIIKTAHEIR